MVFAHIQITVDARHSSVASSVSLSLDTASTKTLFFIHVYYHTMATVCYQFYGWTGSKLQLLHKAGFTINTEMDPT